MDATGDPVVPYEGGRSWIGPRPFPNIPDWVGRWAARNGCAAPPRDSALSASVSRRAYAGCAGGADVVLYTLRSTPSLPVTDRAARPVILSLSCCLPPQLDTLDQDSESPE